MEENTTPTKTIAAIIAASVLATGGGIAIDNATVTDAEIKSSINLAIEQGKIPAIDMTKVDFDRLAKGYLEVASDHGIDLTEAKENEENIYDLIREKKQEEGELIAPKSEELLLVK